MKILDMIGYYRKETGVKSELKQMRKEGNVPCVMYGAGKENIHFQVPMILFRDLIYTPEACFVNMDIEGSEYKCVLQDAQFHPVSEIILHADFLFLNNDKELKMDIPVKFEGRAPGVAQGGKLVTKLRKITVKALPDNMPEVIVADISNLELGKSIKIGALPQENYTILNHPMVTVGTIAIPRVLKSAQSKGEEEEA